MISVDDVSEILQVARPTAAALVKFMTDLDPPMLIFRGERASPSGKGKGAHVYDVAENAARRMKAIIEKLKETV
jgi:hypothetical protein